MKKRISFFLICVGLFSLLVLPVFAGGLEISSVAQVKTMQVPRGKTWVMMQGTLAPASRHEWYILTDSTGEISLEIDDDAWRGLIIRSGETVVVEGKLEKKGPSIKIEIKNMMKPGETGSQLVKAAQARQMPDDTWVILRGYIKRNIEKDMYLFQDSSGEIAVKIKSDIMRNLGAGPETMVEIRGEVDWEKRSASATIDVEYAGVL